MQQTDQAGAAATPAAATGALPDVWFNNPTWAWATAGAVALAIVILAWIVRSVIIARVGRFVGPSGGGWAGFVVAMARSLRLWLVVPWAVYIASQWLLLPAGLGRALQIASVAAVAVQWLVWAPVIVDRFIQVLLARTSRDGVPDEAILSSAGVVKAVGMIVLVALIALLALDNLGVKITPLLAGLGIGGVAIALATQSILGDIFASVSILLDKPFVVGDFIVVGDKMGTVERIGVKTTRVRALSGEQLVFANSDLLTSRIQNFKRMQERRALFSIGVVYHTPPEKLRAIPRIVREAVEHNPRTRFDRCHFKTFGAYSLDFECVYFMLVPDFNAYMDTQQAVNLELFERFAAEGIEFAFPTQVEIQVDGTRRDEGAGREPGQDGRIGR
jgi:small-conductance mechanosensitive channel